MDFPGFYQPDRVGQLVVPDVNTAFKTGHATGASPASLAQVKTILLLVDMQVDFVHIDGALSVPGAVDDTRRVIEWIFRNFLRITAIAASLDSHVPMSIFFPTWWSGEDGQHPQPHTVIRSEDVKAGRWKPIYQPDWSIHYCETLEELAKKELMVWPFHTLIGTPGHALTPALYEAIAFHSAARQAQPIFLQKGTIPQTEYYSMLEPEVKVADHEMGELNTSFLNMLASYDRIYVAGEAKSHCVLETVASIMRYFERQPRILRKFYILEDCMSSVAHPTIDFEVLARQAFARFADMGLQLVKSSDPVW
jgi:nicotinamidase-related amidase